MGASVHPIDHQRRRLWAAFHEEVGELVTPEVATRLDPGERYRIWWFNRRRVVRTQVFENGENGRRYRKRSTTAYQPREERIAVPVPDYGISRGLTPEAWPDPL